MRDPGLRWAVLLALAIVAVSCKGDTKKQADPASAAGDVREVTGAVSATRDGDTRTLEVGDTVAAGERVTTGPDGDVVIELRHNHVRWHLGPDQAKTPMEAVAWSAPPPAASSEVSGDRTSVAGRHAERSAAQTAAGAVAGSEPSPGGGSTAGSGTATVAPTSKGDAPPRTKKKDVPPDDTRRQPTVEPTNTGGGGSGSGSSGCDEVGCLVAATPPACCAKYRKKGEEHISPDGAELPDTLGRDEVTAGIANVKSKFLACGEKFPDAPANVKIKLKVSASGSVTSVTVVDEVEDGLESCLESAAKGAKFAVTQKGGSFTYPAALR